MSGTDSGWIKLHRRFLRSAIWQNPNVRIFWVWCLLKATHDGYTTTVGLKRIPLEPGQFLYNHSLASTETLLSQKVVRSCLEFLKSGDTPEIGQAKGSLRGNRFSIVTINNWDTYQGVGDSEGRQRAGKRASKGQSQGSLINKEGKNGKKHTGVGTASPVESETWMQWVEACRTVGRKDPAPSPAALQAAKDLATWVPDLDERRCMMDAYLALDDAWVRRQGFQLTILTKHRFEAVRAIMDGRAEGCGKNSSGYADPSDDYELSPSDVAAIVEFEREEARRAAANG